MKSEECCGEFREELRGALGGREELINVQLLWERMMIVAPLAL